MYTIVKEVYGNQLGDRVASGWLRYIDDCWIIWKASYGDIDTFKHILRDLHPSIKFTMEGDRHLLNFLDVCVYKEADRLETDIINLQIVDLMCLSHLHILDTLYITFLLL